MSEKKVRGVQLEGPDQLRADAIAYSEYQKNSDTRPMVSRGIRKALRDAMPEPPEYKCPYCDDSHGAPYCFKFNRHFKVKAPS